MNKRDQLRDEWLRLADDALAAAMDVVRAHLENDPEIEILRSIAKDAIARSREADARYKQACEEERRQG